LALRPDGIFVAPFADGEIGPELFPADMRLEGLASKCRDPLLSGWPVEALDQSQKPQAYRDWASDGVVRMVTENRTGGGFAAKGM
jgi:hypothetical protein